MLLLRWQRKCHAESQQHRNWTDHYRTGSQNRSHLLQLWGAPLGREDNGDLLFSNGQNKMMLTNKKCFKMAVSKNERTRKKVWSLGHLWQETQLFWIHFQSRPSARFVQSESFVLKILLCTRPEEPHNNANHFWTLHQSKLEHWKRKMITTLEWRQRISRVPASNSILISRSKRASSSVPFDCKLLIVANAEKSSMWQYPVLSKVQQILYNRSTQLNCPNRNTLVEWVTLDFFFIFPVNITLWSKTPEPVSLLSSAHDLGRIWCAPGISMLYDVLNNQFLCNRQLSCRAWVAPESQHQMRDKTMNNSTSLMQCYFCQLKWAQKDAFLFANSRYVFKSQGFVFACIFLSIDDVKDFLCLQTRVEMPTSKTREFTRCTQHSVRLELVMWHPTLAKPQRRIHSTPAKRCKSLGAVSDKGQTIKRIFVPICKGSELLTTWRMCD